MQQIIIHISIGELELKFAIKIYLLNMHILTDPIDDDISIFAMYSFIKYTNNA